MPQSLTVSAKKLAKHASKLRSYVAEDKTHPNVYSAVRQTCGSLLAAVTYVDELLPTASAYVDKITKRAKAARQSKQPTDILPATVFNLAAFKVLVESADLISKFVDAGIDVIDVYRTGQSAKLRRNQVAIASNLMAWLEAVSFVCLSWCFRAQRCILATQGKAQTSEDDVLAMVEKRIVSLATS